MNEPATPAPPANAGAPSGAGAIPPTSLDVIEKSTPQTIDAVADEQTKEERESIEERHRHLENVGLEQDISERRKYAHRNFCLIASWLIVINAMLFCQGFRITVCGHAFDLPNSVLITVIGSTTATVLGIFVIVTRYLFPTAKSIPSPTDV